MYIISDIAYNNLCLTLYSADLSLLLYYSLLLLLITDTSYPFPKTKFSYLVIQCLFVYAHYAIISSFMQLKFTQTKRYIFIYFMYPLCLNMFQNNFNMLYLFIFMFFFVNLTCLYLVLTFSYLTCLQLILLVVHMIFCNRYRSL